MRNFVAVLLVAFSVSVPAVVAAGPGHDHHHCRGIHMTHHTSLDIEGDLLVITHLDRREHEEIVISDDGELTIDGQRIETDGKSRKLLKKFFKEAARLEEQADLIAEDAEELADDATAFAAAAIRQALRGLSDEDDDEADAEFADLKVDFEGRSELVERLGDEIGDQADKLTDLAEQLKDRIPELDQVDWFLGD